MKTFAEKTQELTAENEIIVIGDLHADWSMTLALFINLKLCDKNKKWIGGNKIVVQLGDQIDGYGRGGNLDAYGEDKILELLDDLNEQAQIYGGAVYSLLGNHEMMNVMGNLSYVSKKDMKTKNRTNKFIQGSNLAKKWASTRNIIMRINDIIFVHGGIVPEMTEGINENIIKKLNNIAHDFLRGDRSTDDKEVQKYLIDSNTAPIWNREFGVNEPNCARLNKTLKSFTSNLNDNKINHIIVGHTVQNTINSKCDNKIFRVDVGLSQALGGKTPQVLSIKRLNGKNSFNKLI